MDVSEMADLLLTRLEEALGPNIFDALILWIANEYLGEMEVRTAIIKRPDLFERAFIHALGEAGEALLKTICGDIHKDYALAGRQYSKKGDLPACIAMARSS